MKKKEYNVILEMKWIFSNVFQVYEYECERKSDECEFIYRKNQTYFDVEIK